MNVNRHKTVWMSAMGLAMVSLATFPVASASEAQPQAEILHWWTSDGESKALQVFIDEFEARGGTFYDSSAESHAASREEAIDRMNKGYPATFTQWNAGADIKDFYEFGLTTPITDPEIKRRLQENLPAAVMTAVTHMDQVVAMPLNLHSENWMWSTPELLELGPELLSADWSAFLERGRALAEEGLPLVAVGNQSWQVRIFFTSVLLGVSRDAYKSLYLDNAVDLTEREDFRTALEVFTQLAQFSHSFGEGNWDTQVRAVAEHKAASVFMGDWAKGELLSRGLKPGEDFDCSLSSTQDPSLLVVVDTLMLGKVEDPSERAGQALMLDVVSNVDTSMAFNKLKGSVSPFAQASADMDPCTQQVYTVMKDDAAVLPPYTAFRQRNDFIHRVDTLINDTWQRALAGEESNASLVAATLDQFSVILKDRYEWEQQTENALEE